MNTKSKSLAVAGATAALYVVLTMISTALNLSSGIIQLRLSEALCILPIFTPAAIPGLFIGCLISNLLSGCIIWDVIFGSLATLIGAVFTSLLKKRKPLAFAMPILSNMVIVPFVLIYAYHLNDAWWLIVLTVGAGELLSVGLLGTILYRTLNRLPIHRYL